MRQKLHQELRILSRPAIATWVAFTLDAVHSVIYVGCKKAKKGENKNAHTLEAQVLCRPSSTGEADHPKTTQRLIHHRRHREARSRAHSSWGNRGDETRFSVANGVLKKSTWHR